MGSIAYDPVKNRFAGLIRRSKILRRVFYGLLDLFFLRSWHVRRLLRRKGDELDRQGEWTLLDAGCGFGQYDRFVLDRFKNVKVVALDVKQDYLEDCMRYFREEVKEGRIRFERKDLLVPEEEKKYDFILCIDVLEHIEEDLTVLENLANSLREGGGLLIHSPSRFSGRDADNGESFTGEHARTGYSKDEIGDKFRRAGLSVCRVHYTYGFFGRFSWILSVKYPMLLLSKTGMTGLLPLAVYYPLVLPACLLMNAADLLTANEKGNGICALGTRRSTAPATPAVPDAIEPGLHPAGIA